MWVVLFAYIFFQAILTLIFRAFAWGAVMYVVSGEMKDLCEKYGPLCDEYNLLYADDPETIFFDEVDELT